MNFHFYTLFLCAALNKQDSGIVIVVRHSQASCFQDSRQTIQRESTNESHKSIVELHPVHLVKNVRTKQVFPCGLFVMPYIMSPNLQKMWYIVICIIVWV